MVILWHDGTDIETVGFLYGIFRVDDLASGRATIDNGQSFVQWAGQEIGPLAETP